MKRNLKILIKLRLKKYNKLKNNKIILNYKLISKIDLKIENIKTPIIKINNQK